MRCAPHVIGVLLDALPFSRQASRSSSTARTTTRSSTPSTGAVLHGGHFYGGHVAFAMDGLKTAVANVADLLDRQLALLVDARYNHGLPAEPVRRRTRARSTTASRRCRSATSAWTAEALKLTMPATVVLALAPSATTRTR